MSLCIPSFTEADKHICSVVNEKLSLLNLIALTCNWVFLNLGISTTI